jgi:1-acyl-sn-glycerol-3-phosphate acyltransferase
MELFQKVFNGVVRFGLGILCRIDAGEIEKIPSSGPLIIYTNHTGSVEVPLVFVLLQPRPITGLAKVETWDNAFMAWLFDLWGAIPIRRGEADMEAMRKALESLKSGKILGISPEGTRNITGRLLRAHPGIVALAIHSHASIIPLAHWGGEKFKTNLKGFKRTDFHIRVGKPFQIYTNGQRIDKEIRQKIADEMMYQLALMLPDDYRGEYSDLSKMTNEYLKDPIDFLISSDLLNLEKNTGLFPIN